MQYKTKRDLLKRVKIYEMKISLTTHYLFMNEVTENNFVLWTSQNVFSFDKLLFLKRNTRIIMICSLPT